MILVVIESPYAGAIKTNMLYLKDCVLDCLRRGESPYASHAIFPQFLDDDNIEERALGIGAGLAWAEAAKYIVVYTDLGLTTGMRYAMEAHKKAGRVIEYRSLANWGKNEPETNRAMSSP